MKVKLDPGAKMPTRAHDNDAGLDLYAVESKWVWAFDKARFDTGVHIEIPRGFVGLIKSKSSLNIQYGLTCEGVIDSGYTGSIVVNLLNTSDTKYRVVEGQKIAQLVLVPIITPDLELVEDLEETERGANGFGSTGRF